MTDVGRTSVAEPVGMLRAAGNQDLARAVWAFAHGMVQLELARRFPPGADLDSAWQEGITAFQARMTAHDSNNHTRLTDNRPHPPMPDPSDTPQLPQA
jgi:WHG domain-containing protein